MDAFILKFSHISKFCSFCSASSSQYSILSSVVTSDHSQLMSPRSADPGSGFYHLRELRPIADSPVTVNRRAKTLVHAFISSRLEYCRPNSLLFGVPDVLLRKVQSVQNAAARLVTGAKRRDHITPVLSQLTRERTVNVRRTLNLRC